MTRNSKRILLACSLCVAVLAVYLGTVTRPAQAQQIPGAPAGAVSLRWSISGVDVSQYSDAGFLWPNAGGAPQGGQGTWYALADGGTQTLVAGPFEVQSQSNVEIDVSTVGTPTGVLQAQESNDGMHWGNVGGAQGMDGGSGAVYAFGGAGTNQQISPTGAALLRIVDSSTSTANSTVAATAFAK